MTSESDAVIDSVLQEQLRQSEAPDASVGAVFTLRGTSADEFLSAAETESLARRVIERAARESHCEPETVNVLSYLQSFVVQAPKALMRSLIKQPEISTATANIQSKDLFIQPTKRREVSLDDAKAEEHQPKPPIARRRRRR